MNIKKATKLFKGFFLVGLLTFSNIASQTKETSAAAIDNDPNPALYLTARWVDAVVTCTRAISPSGEPALKETLRLDEYNRMDIFVSGSGNNGRIITGHDLEYSGGLSGDDGVASCEEIVLPGIAPVAEIFGSTSALVDLFYTKSGATYQRKDEAGRKAASDALLAKAFVSANNRGDIRKARLSVAFSECFKESADGSSDIAGLSKDFVYINNRDSGSEIAVGLGDINSSSEKLTCSTLANLAKESEEDLISFMEDNNVTTGVLRNNPQNLYANIRASSLSDTVVSSIRTGVLTALRANPDKVSFCLAAASLPTTIGTESIAEWLVTGNYEDNLIYAGAGRGIPATAQQAESLKACLLDEQALGNQLAPLLASLNSSLEVINEELVNNTGSSSESTTEDDVCLSEGDNFISWAACPLINLLNDAFDKIKVTLQDMLKFSIEDSGPGTAGSVNELENAWNVFRGIASILIIIFFLTALLVKSIKGE